MVAVFHFKINTNTMLLQIGILYIVWIDCMERFMNLMKSATFTSISLSTA
jgi:hypothetical protein